jgi:hypothetical protein
MFEDLLVIDISGEKVYLDRNKLNFNELTLSEYIEKEGGYIDYFGAMLSLAEKELANIENEIERLNIEYEKIYSKKFSDYKSEHNGSDKFVEAKVFPDSEVQAAKLNVIDAKGRAIEAKYKVRLLQQHLRAWDKNHENAQSRGHFLRKEMDKLNRDIYLRSKTDDYLESKVDDIVKEVDLNKLGE